MITSIEGGKDYYFLQPSETVRIARELKNFIGNNAGYRSLMPVLIQECRGQIDSSTTFAKRLLRLQLLFQAGFKYAAILETTTRKFDAGVAVLIPSLYGNNAYNYPTRFEQLYTGNCETFAVRLDIARINKDWQFVAAYGVLSLNEKARIAGEELYGVRLNINSDLSARGQAINFRGLGRVCLSEAFTLDSVKHQPDILATIQGAETLSFCQKPILLPRR